MAALIIVLFVFFYFFSSFISVCVCVCVCVCVGRWGRRKFAHTFSFFFTALTAATLGIDSFSVVVVAVVVVVVVVRDAPASCRGLPSFT